MTYRITNAAEIALLAAIIGLAAAAPRVKADEWDTIAEQNYRNRQIEAQEAQARAQEEIARQIQQQNIDRVFEGARLGNRSWR